MINSFPGYEFKKLEDNNFHNIYRGVDVGFGGYVYAEPGVYYDVALLDVGNMHGASIIALNKFGEYTKNYKEIRDARMAIKEGLKTGDFSKANNYLGGRLSKYLTSPEVADSLQNALKLILNSTYGIAAATFDNPLHDKRDVNNIIALRGALFMKTLQDEVVKKGYKVCHIKTDSIKVANADKEIIDFILNFGKEYGYEFEHECTYSKICLVNDAVYVAKYDNLGIRNKGGKHANEWTATGTQFQVPYVFKTLFSHEPIEFNDMCETKSVSTSLYLDMNETLPNVAAAEKDLGKYEDMLELGKISQDDFDKVSYMLKEEIAQGHDYHFIGKVGQFCPILPGFGGGLLRREKDGKYYAVTGTKKKDGTLYRWLESEMVRTLEKEDYIDESYYQNLCNDAVKAIDKAGEPFGITYDMFIDDNYIPLPVSVTKVATDEEIPFA